MGIQGEGEAAFPLLLKRLQRKAECSWVPGLVLPTLGTEAKARPIKILEEFPLPLLEDHPGFFSIPANQQLWLPVQTHRGCPMECIYCSTATIEGPIMRRRSPAAMVETLSRYLDEQKAPSA